jgi:nitrite reductase/ring-hydroxylating ferredoxin subunit
MIFARIFALPIVVAVIALAACNRNGDFIEIMNAEKGISVNIKGLIEKKPVFYKAEIKGTEFEFFVIKINGEVRAFLNRCKKCYGSGLGFSFDETHVRCRACNEKFQIEDIAHGVGSCYPIPLASAAQGDTISIKIEPLR